MNDPHDPTAPYGAPYPQGQYGLRPGPPHAPPRKVTTARLIIFVICAIQALLGLAALAAAVSSPDDLSDQYDVPAGLFAVLGAGYLVHALIGFLLAARFNTGTDPVRITTLVWAGVLVLIGITALPLGIVWMVLGAVCLTFLSRPEAVDWFRRPRI